MLKTSVACIDVNSRAALASIIGLCMLQSGAADRIVRWFLGIFGERRAGLALLVSTYIVSIPIFFDTLFMLLVPIALGLGAGADSRRPLGLAVVGGLVVSQFLTLYITPVIYVYMDRFTAKARKRIAAKEALGSSEPAMAK